MRYRKSFAIAATLAVFSVAPTFSMGQAAQAQGTAPASQSASTSQPCGAGDEVNAAATQVSTGVTGIGNDANSIAGAETRFKSMWAKKSKTSTTTTAATTTPAATTPNTLTTATATTQNAAGKAGAGAKPCGPAKAGAGAKQEAAAGTKPAAPATTTAAAATPGAGKVESMTTMPDGTYMLGYTPANATDKSYAPVKKVGPLSKPTGPNDGYYTDDKNFYTVTGSQVSVTPVGGATTATATTPAKTN